jgi:formylglycine-generating enzyme required for sulfatase activity
VPSAAQSPAVSSTKKVIKQATAHESPGIKRDFTAKGQVELVELPEGTFRMGSPNDEGFLYERPQHEVTVSSFWMGRYEVTHGQYRLYLQANPKAPKPYERMDSGPADKPVIGVSWDDANAFARWAGARLPTEAEWEYACRAGTEESRYGELDAIAWYDKNSKNQAHPVGMKQPNAWGLHDMLGNVWEWCSDWHGPYHPVPVTDPSGPTMGSERVFRGGAWGSGARRARAAGRERYVPGDRGVSLGFRLARGQPPASK